VFYDSCLCDRPSSSNCFRQNPDCFGHFMDESVGLRGLTFTRRVKTALLDKEKKVFLGREFLAAAATSLRRRILVWTYCPDQTRGGKFFHLRKGMSHAPVVLCDGVSEAALSEFANAIHVLYTDNCHYERLLLKDGSADTIVARCLRSNGLMLMVLLVSFVLTINILLYSLY
jgi:hypothetical protein